MYASRPIASQQRTAARRASASRPRHTRHDSRPVAAFRQRGIAKAALREEFTAPEVWHEPTGTRTTQYIVQDPGVNYAHPVTADEVRARLAALPPQFTRNLEVVQFSAMTRKRRNFPCYGMQWGNAVYLYPIERTLIERYVCGPNPQQLIEARMFGGVWSQQGKLWHLTWTPDTIRDFFLNNVLIHEVGHLNDSRNRSYRDRERYANWFAIEYGYRATGR